MEYYDQIASAYDELYGEEQKNKARIILQHLPLTPSTTLLDIGCGTGIATALFPCNTTGIDTSPQLIEQAKKRINAQVADAHHLPFPDQSFDIVISLTAAHHFSLAAFIEMKRVAKSQIVITILKKSSKREELDSTIRKLFKVTKVVHDKKDIIYLLTK